MILTEPSLTPFGRLAQSMLTQTRVSSSTRPFDGLTGDPGSAGGCGEVESLEAFVEDIYVTALLIERIERGQCGRAAFGGHAEGGFRGRVTLASLIAARVLAGGSRQEV